MSTSTITSPKNKRELTAQLAWTAFILLFFVIQAVLWTVAISATSQDSSHAVVAGYDQQSLTWDEEKKRRSASEKLGWQATASFGETADIRSIRDVSVEIFDDKGQPIQDAKVELSVFHRGHAANVHALTLTNTGNGRYKAEMPVRHDGWWVFDGTAKVNDAEYLIKTSIQIKR